MKKDFLIFLCALSALFIIPITVQANTVTVDGATGVTSTYLPVALHTNTSNANYAFHSVSQQLYYASELAGASSTKITAITFDYEGTTFTRKIAVLMNSTSLSSFPLPNEGDLEDEANKTPNMVNPGTRVFSGDVNMVDRESYTITFDTPYEWDGTSNIIVTVLDSTAKKNSKTYYPDATIYTVKVRIFETEGAIRFLHKTSKDQSDYANKGWDMSDLSAAKANSSSVGNRKYANRITFTFAAAAVVPATPSDLAVSSVNASSATLAWSAVEGATSYDLQQSADGESWSTLSSGETGTSFNWTGLSAASTQFARIRATNAVGSSDWSSAVTVTTDAPHEHNGISFSKWASTTSMPTSGNYYLANDVVYDFYEGGYLDLAGDLNLCLNGHTINLGTKSINVTNGKTMTIFDHIGGGKITGFVPGLDGIYTYQGVISVENNGTLVIREGEVENTYPADDPEYKSIAIAVAGTLILSGSPVISSYEMDIFLLPTIPAKVITIEPGKPLTNTTPYKVYKMDGVITSGWDNMSGEDPKDYFVSANPERVVCLNGSGEAELVAALALNENSSENESRIAAQENQLVNVNLTRSTLTSSQFNTFCLPFALSNAQLEEIFGAGYDLEEFVSSEIVGDELVLSFNKVTSLEAGKPYLLQPSVNVVNPAFEGVTITAIEPVAQTSDEFISFHGVFNPTELTGGNKNLLFLGSGNELFWPASTGNLKGFRAYFEVKGAAQKAKAARIVKKEDQSQAIENVENPDRAQKRIVNGQLIIEKNGRFYNAQGQIVK